jgi:hypothetical protein
MPHAADKTVHRILSTISVAGWLNTHSDLCNSQEKVRHSYLAENAGKERTLHQKALNSYGKHELQGVLGRSPRLPIQW